MLGVSVDFSKVQLQEIRGIFREEMQAIEMNAYLKGISPKDLMVTAGSQVASYLNKNYNFSNKKILIVISSGNNGGDGLVIARLLENYDTLTIIQLSKKNMKSKEGKDVLAEFNEYSTSKSKINKLIISDDVSDLLQDPTKLIECYKDWTSISITEIFEHVKKVDVIIDSIFGFKLNSKVKEPYNFVLAEFAKLFELNPTTETIETKESQIDVSTENQLSQTEVEDQQDQDINIEERYPMLFSVDIPSGLDCNNGKWHCEPYFPTLILTFQYSKRGIEKHHMIYEVLDIGIEDRQNYIPDDIFTIFHFPERDPDSHKGLNGRILIIGGSDEYTGAPVLSSLASLRMGSDTVRTVVPESIRDIVAGYSKDFLILKVKGNYHSTRNTKFLADLAIRRHNVCVMGMGLSNKDDCLKFIRDFIRLIHTKMSLVIDADAIRAFRGNLGLLHNTKAVITPHRAELRWVLEEEIPSDPQELVDFLQMKARQLGITIVLKGRVDIITNGYRTFLNYTGHPGMTVGGTGDVLAGVIGAVAGFVRIPFFAAVIGTYIMGKAGELAAEKYGNGLLASDVVEELPNVLLEMEKKRLAVKQFGN
jgi:ADP-dependent NAD(P)H-hydrate dehydratase / NAD(P)H-hydrate epimerase